MSTMTKHPDVPSATSQKVLDALTSSPLTTGAELAARAGLGRSTVTKQLALLEHAGHARRSAGGRDGSRRLPDRSDHRPDLSREAGRRRHQAATPSARRRHRIRASTAAARPA